MTDDNLFEGELVDFIENPRIPVASRTERLLLEAVRDMQANRPKNKPNWYGPALYHLQDLGYNI